jgi:hypothetical protein
LLDQSPHTFLEKESLPPQKIDISKRFSTTETSAYEHAEAQTTPHVSPVVATVAYDLPQPFVHPSALEVQTPMIPDFLPGKISVGRRAL